MMPMPPTSSEIDARIANKSAMARLVFFAVAAISLKLRTLKSSGSPARMR